MKKILILVCALALTANFSFAKETAKDTKECEMKSCAMCSISDTKCEKCEANIQKCAKCETVKEKGKEYSFCCKDCKKMFTKDKKKNIAALNAKMDEKVYCPVMKNEITVGTAYDKAEYKGKTVYLCCAECKEAFAKNPKKYMKNLEKWEKEQVKKTKAKE